MVNNDDIANDFFILPMDYFREIGMRVFVPPEWFRLKTAMRADEIWRRDVPRAVFNVKRIVKKLVSIK